MLQSQYPVPVVVLRKICKIPLYSCNRLLVRRKTLTSEEEFEFWEETEVTRKPHSDFGGLEVVCWPLVPKFAGSHPAEAFRFLGRKKTSARLPSEEPSVPCRSFTACKRSLNVTWKSAFRQHFRTFFAHSSTFRRWVLSRSDTRGDAWWRKLERLTQIAQ